MECTMQIGKLLANLHAQGDPCSDFYQHACGGWIERMQRLRGGTLSGSYAMNTDFLQQIVDDQLHDSLEKAKSSKVWGFREAGRFYQRCLNDISDFQEELDDQADEVVQTELGGFLTEEEWLEHGRVDLTSLLVTVHQNLGSGLFAVTPIRDPYRHEVWSFLISSESEDLSSSYIQPEKKMVISGVTWPQPTMSLLTGQSRSSAVDAGKFLARLRQLIGLAEDDVKSLLRMGVTYTRQQQQAQKQGQDVEARFIYLAHLEASKLQQENAEFNYLDNSKLTAKLRANDSRQELHDIFYLSNVVRALKPSLKQGRVESENVIYRHWFTLEQLQQYFTFVKWRKLVSELFPEYVRDEPMRVYVSGATVTYLQHVSALVAAIPERLLYNTLILQYRTETMKNIVDSFTGAPVAGDGGQGSVLGESTARGRHEYSGRRRTVCLETTGVVYTAAAGGLLVRRQSRHKVQQLTRTIQTLFEELKFGALQRLETLSNDTSLYSFIQAAKSRIEHLTAWTVASDQFWNNTFINVNTISYSNQERLSSKHGNANSARSNEMSHLGEILQFLKRSQRQHRQSVDKTANSD